MIEMILLFIVFCGFCFGATILEKVVGFGFAVADKMLANSGKLVKAPFKIAFKLIGMAFRFVFKKKSNESDAYTVRPVHMITPLQLQQMRNQQLSLGSNKAPVEIEYIQPKRLK